MDEPWEHHGKRVTRHRRPHISSPLICNIRIGISVETESRLTVAGNYRVRLRGNAKWLLCFWSNEYVLKLIVVMAAHLHDYGTNHWVVHFFFWIVYFEWVHIWYTNYISSYFFFKSISCLKIKAHTSARSLRLESMLYIEPVMKPQAT